MNAECFLLTRTTAALPTIERSITFFVVPRLPLRYDLPRNPYRIGGFLLRLAIKQHRHGKTAQLCLRHSIKSAKIPTSPHAEAMSCFARCV